MLPRTAVGIAMSPPRTGSFEKRHSKDGKVYYRARVRLGDGSRARIDIPEKYSRAAGGKSGEERAELYALAIQEREAETGELLAKKDAGKRAQIKPNAEMVNWLDAWIDARQAGGQTSTRENRSHYVTHIAPAIGAKHLRDWTADDLRTLSRHLDLQIETGTIAWKTARNVWTTAGKMLADSVRSKRDELRCRTTNPIRDVEGPNRGAQRAHPYLYPSELLAFVSSSHVPLMWRRALALAVYTYARAAELRALRWEDIDLEHGTIHLHRARDRVSGEDKSTKNKQARRFSLEPSILPLFRTMQAEAEEEGRGPADHVVELTSERDLARGLKRWLRKAGINRPDLYVTDATRQAMRFHDLRATGITWMAVRGDPPQVIQSRAGHTDYATTLGYIREAETLAAGFGKVFPPLPPLATDWANHWANSRKLVPKYSELLRGGRDSNPRPPA
jgi:integrase